MMTTSNPAIFGECPKCKESGWIYDAPFGKMCANCTHDSWAEKEEASK